MTLDKLRKIMGERGYTESARCNGTKISFHPTDFMNSPNYEVVVNLENESNMAQIKNAYIVHIDFDGDIKSKYCWGTWLVFTELKEVKPVIAEALTDLMRHQEERDRAATIEVGEYCVPIADVLKSDNLLDEYIDYGGSDMGNWEISIYKTF